MKSIMTTSIHYLRAAIGLAVAILLLEASQAMANPSCGDIITADVTLSADLNCTNPSADGLIIGGDHVTLDLNGHTIKGPGLVGVRITGTNATVTNTGTWPGTVTGFEYGVYINPTWGAKIIGLTLTGNGRGIATGQADWNIICANVISRNSQDGIRLGISSNNTISGNTVSKNDFGIAIADGSNCNVVSGNSVSKNRNFGVAIFCGSDSNMIFSNSVTNTTEGEAHGIIVRSGSDLTQLMWNSANVNAGDGIHVDIGGNCQDSNNNVMPMGTVIEGNVANRNGNDGIEVAATGSATVQDNTANVNSGYGIFAPDTCDGSGNVTNNNFVQQTYWGTCSL